MGTGQADPPTRRRVEVGSGTARGVTQVLDIAASAGSRPLDLVQHQIFISVQDMNDPGRRAVLELVLTQARGQPAALLDDFRKFVDTLRATG